MRRVDYFAVFRYKNAPSKQGIGLLSGVCEVKVNLWCRVKHDFFRGFLREFYSRYRV